MCGIFKNRSFFSSTYSFQKSLLLKWVQLLFPLSEIYIVFLSTVVLLLKMFKKRKKEEEEEEDIVFLK